MAQVLTPSGYRDLDSCQVGDAVLSATGKINRIESIQLVDANEWQRWHAHRDVPDFLSYRINDDFTLFGEQSIFHNDGKVTHVKHLRPGSVVFHNGKAVRVKRVRKIDALPWHRLDIDGDHSYIGDGIRLHNANRFWVGGTGTYDASDTTHWSGSSGGAGGSSVPGTGDTATWNGSSGGGTATVNTTVAIQSITCGAFTGTLDFSANNNNVTLSANGGFSGTGTGARTISLGNGTWSFTSTAGGGITPWNMATTTNLTFNANSSVLNFGADSVAATNRNFVGGGLTYATVQVGAQSNGATFSIDGINTFGTLTVTGRNQIIVVANQTITNLNLNGTSSGPIFLLSDTPGTRRTLTITTPSATWVAVRDIAGSGTWANSLDFGNNSGITITPPSTSGGAWPPIGTSATFMRTA